MSPNKEILRRQSIRLQDFNYSNAGAYFITISTQDRYCLFGDIEGGRMRLNVAGGMIQSTWQELPIRFGYVELDEFIVMPDHFHGVVVIRPGSIGGQKGCPDGDNCRGESCIRPVIKGDHEDRPYDTGGTVDHKDRPYDTGGTVDHKDRPYDGGLGDHKDRPHGTLPNTIGRIVQAFKSLTTHAYVKGVKDQGWLPFHGKLWQRNYWDRIIRNESELNDIREYIINNPARWESRKSL